MITILFLIFLLALVPSFQAKKSLGCLKRAHILLLIAFLSLFVWSILILTGSNLGNFLTFSIFSVGLLEGIFLLIYSIVGIAVLVYQFSYAQRFVESKRSFLTVNLTVFLASMFGVLVSNEAMTFLVFWELMSLSSYFLVVHEMQSPETKKSGLRYLVLTHIGMFGIALSFLPFVVATHSSFFSDWIAISFPSQTLAWIFVLSLIGFGGKSGLFPLHIWLPKAHPIAPSSISALMSGFMVKLPIFLLLKMYLVFLGGMELWMAYVLLILGGISAFWGIFHGLTQNNIKKFLAYSTIENMGLIFVGLGLVVAGGVLKNQGLFTLGLTATLLHTVNHALYKTMLFLMAGSLIERTHHNYDYSRLGGIAKIFPAFSILFLLATLSIAGVPPFAGFNSEMSVFMGLAGILGENTQALLSLVSVVTIVLVGLMSVLSLIGFAKLYTLIFSGNPRDPSLHIDTTVNTCENIAYRILSVALITITLLPGIVSLLVAHAFHTKNIRELGVIKIQSLFYVPGFLACTLVGLMVLLWMFYKKIAGTQQKMRVWNCGYPCLVPKSQYRAESLIQAIRRLYKGLYSEKDQVTYHAKDPSQQYYKKYLTHVCYTRVYFYKVRFLYERILSGVLLISEKLKSLQNGVLQIYVSYMLITLVLGILWILIFQ